MQAASSGVSRARGARHPAARSSRGRVEVVGGRRARRRSQRPLVGASLLGLGVALLAAAVSLAWLPSSSAGGQALSGLGGGSSTAADAEAPPPPAGQPEWPVEVEARAIGLDAPIVPLGLDRRGRLEAPEVFEHAGWYSDGPAPGATGPAVIAGHVDSSTGPAVFARLSELRVGDELRVRRADGRAVAFRVDGVERHHKDALPTRRVYGDTDEPELRLVTCGGSFDPGEGSYRENVIVFASLVGSSDSSR